ncbi:MAG TPA: pyridoxamine 5'-phosphate oxidase family protein [Ilumatobacteraceae bacterium]|nr:pyridoxamine 5'-phosphate oxidase family protein [Ilumatobacteraceae bacterium]
MTVALTEIARCFQGSIPSIIATSSIDGEPNITHLSQVFLVDDQHVATSNQFFAKTVANLAANPLATLLCPDPVDMVTYKLLVRHEGTQRDGALFDAARASIDAIAALTGMSDVFALRSMDVFCVLNIEVAAPRPPDLPS